MKRKYKKMTKSIISLILVLTMVVQVFGTSMVYGKNTGFVSEDYHYLEAATMPEEILSADTFYVGTTSADLAETSEKPYLLKIGRGGDCLSEASVVLKISDATANYGEDYIIRIHGEETEAVSPEDNESLVDLIQSQDPDEISETVLPAKEEQIEAIQGMQENLQEKSEENLIAKNPLAQAKENLTGIESDREPVKSAQQDMVDVLSGTGNYLTQLLPGATLTVDFDACEMVKYVEIIPIDNEKSDGNRIFYVTLSAPSQGYTNSMVSESIFTLKDDEPQEDAVITFAEATYTAEGDTVEVVLERTGAMNETVSMHMTSHAENAVSGRDFAPVDAEVTFPFGITKRTLQITVNGSYLTEDGTFTLQLSDGAGAVVGEQAEAKVLIPYEPKEKITTTKDAKEESSKEIYAQRSLGDTTYGKPFTFNVAGFKVRGEGNVTYPGNQVSLYGNDTWVDFAVNLSSSNQIFKPYYIYDGVRFSWSKSSSKPSWNSHNISVYRTETGYIDSKILMSDDKERFGWQEAEYRFGVVDPAAVKFYLSNTAGWGTTMTLDWIIPVLRPFAVKLQGADPLTYLDKNGNKVSNSNAVITTLANSVNGVAVHVADDNITILQASSHNKISRLTGVKIVHPTSKKSIEIDKKYFKNFSLGNGEINIPLTNDFCTTYKDYITYDGNGDNGKLKGNILLQPVYGYLDSTIIVDRNDEIKMADGTIVTGNTYIHGAKVTYGKAMTYHVGDILKISSDTSDSNYVSSSVKIKNKNTKTQNRDDSDVAYSNGSYDLYVAETEYQLIPNYQEHNNAIIIRVNANELQYIKREGIFSEENMKKNATLANGYYDIVVAGNEVGSSVEVGKDYFFVAEGTTPGYQPVWKETIGNRYYLGNTFLYRPGNRRTANIVYLYMGSASSTLQKSTQYTSIKGSLYYENRVIGEVAAGAPLMLAKDGFFTAAGQYAFMDENGVAWTDAFPFIDQIRIKETNQIRKIGTAEYPLCVRLQMGASGVIDVKDVPLATSGQTVKRSNGTNEVNTYVTDLSDVMIAPALGDVTHISNIEVKNQVVIPGLTKIVPMNDKMTTLTATVTEVEGESAKAVDFLVYDSDSANIKSIIPASKDGGGKWSAVKTFKSDGSEDIDYANGDRIFVQLTTDKGADIKENEGIDFEISDQAKEALKQTVYAPMNTGIMVFKSLEEMEVIQQTLNFGVLEGLDGIPMINNFDANLNIGAFSLETENLYDDQQNIIGTRVKIGVDVSEISDKASLGSENNNLADDGNEYTGNVFTILGNIGKVKDSFKTAASSIKGAKNLTSKELASMGARKWGIKPVVGFYLDFSYRTKKDHEGNVVSRDLELQGGGIFLGADGEFKVAWYALLPLVYIPCYFGVSGEMSVRMDAGGTAQVDHGVTLDEFGAESHNLTETLDFDFKFSAQAQIQIYCGVGLCGTLGVRGGVFVGGQFLWYPSIANRYEYFDPVGFTAEAGFGLWIDLLVFTMPFTYKFLSEPFGLNKQYEEAQEKNEEDLESLLFGDVKKQSLPGTLPQDFQEQSIEEKQEITYQVKERENDPSPWSGKLKSTAVGQVNSMATYKEKNTKTLLMDGYDRPDAQMMDMGEHGTLLVFLQDDKSREDIERTALSYSVYKDGEYSEPVILQTDGTGDYQPNLCDAGEDIIITWVSSNPQTEKGQESDENYAANYLKAQEIYSVKVAKADLSSGKTIAQDTIEQLSNDAYYDAQPVAVYDDLTGEYNVYYIKTAEDTGYDAQATELANPMNTSGRTYSVMVYRVWDSAKGWLVEEFREYEKPEGMTEEEYAQQLQTWNGQRFLSSPIEHEDVNMEDPIISDFTGIGYNGNGVFAYTIDKDNNVDTNEDRDLFIQLYDFETSKTYVPIRITEDDIPDVQPTLVRKGSDTEGTTYLFWRSDNTLKYIDVSSLVKYGVDENGQILESAKEIPEPEDSENPDVRDENTLEGMTEEEIAKATYQFRIDEIQQHRANENQYGSYSQYQVGVDNHDNLYVVWIDHGSIRDGENTKATQEIFAAAMVEKEVISDIPENNVVKSWSLPNQLTNFGKFCDDPAFCITDNGEMLLVYNKFDLEEVPVEGTEETQVQPTDMELASSILEPYGSIDVYGFEISDRTPEVGQEVDVTITFENSGLTASKNGFTAKVYQKSADGTKKELGEIQHTESIIAAARTDHQMTFIADENTVGSCIYVTCTETDLKGSTENSSEAFVSEAEYNIVQNHCYQGTDSKFYVEAIIENTGNKPSATGDKVDFNFDGPYANADFYGLAKSLLATQTLSLAPGESTTITLPLDLPAKAFEKYGRVDVKAEVYPAESEKCVDFLLDTLYMVQPAELTLNGNANMSMKKGESTALTFTYKSHGNLINVTPKYESENQEVVMVEDGKLVAVGGGTTTVTAYAYPYASGTSIEVTVADTSTPEEGGTTQPGDNTNPGGNTNPGDNTQPGGTADSDSQVTKLAKGSIKSMESFDAKKLTVNWKKVKNATGYEVQYATNKKFTKNKKQVTVNGNGKTSTVLKKLAEKKTYYVRVRGFKKVDGVKHYGEYSKVRSIDLSLRPQKVSKISIKAKQKSIVISAVKPKKSTGYCVSILSKKNAKKAVAVKMTKKKKLTISKLKSKQTYYVSIRSYTKTKDGGYVYGKAKIQKVKTK